MKALPVSAALVMAASMALAQTDQRPAEAPLAVKPIPSEASTTDTDMIRSKIERMGYTDVSGLSRDSLGVWRAKAKRGTQTVARHRRQGRPHQDRPAIRAQSAAARCSTAAVAGRLAFRNVRMCRTASGIFSGVSFHGYMLTCELGASIATSIATA